MMASQLPIIFADAALERAFRELCKDGSQSHRRLAKAISDALHELRRRHHEGMVLQGPSVPQHYKTKTGRDSLRQLDIRPHWRVFYEVRADSIAIIDLTCDGFT